MGTRNLCFGQKYKKNIRIFYRKISLFLVVKFSLYLYRRVFVMYSRNVCKETDFLHNYIRDAYIQMYFHNQFDF